MTNSKFELKKIDYLLSVIQSLSLARTLESVIEITRHAARELTGADGATFVLKDGDKCYYIDEDAIGPLWKGLKFPIHTCISGWTMINKQTVSIPDIYQDTRIPHNAYRPTFVKSLLMVPIRKSQPIGAIGNYWASQHEATEEEIHLLEILADSTSTALENIQLFSNLKDTNDSLASALKSRDEFLSIASHELRTPITAIKLQLQMTERQIKKHFLDVIKNPLDLSLKQIDHLSDLVEQLLDVSRIQSQKINLNYEQTNCSDLFKQLTTLYKPQLEKAGCTVNVNVEENIEGEFDCIRLEQIITNLCSNIIKHAPNSNVDIVIKKENEKHLVLEVTDSGPGISPEVKSRLFKRFERGDSSTNLGGLGLGLYIMKNIIEAHRGDIYINSILGKGSKFTIKLPLKKES